MGQLRAGRQNSFCQVRRHQISRPDVGSRASHRKANPPHVAVWLRSSSFHTPGKALPSPDPYPMHPLSCILVREWGLISLRNMRSARPSGCCTRFEPRTSPDLVLELCNPCTCMGRRGAPVLEGQPLGPSLTPLPLPLQALWRSILVPTHAIELYLTIAMHAPETFGSFNQNAIRTVHRSRTSSRSTNAWSPSRAITSHPPLRRSLLKNLPLHENGSDLEQMSRFFAHFSASSSSPYLRFKLSAFVSSHHHVSSAVREG